MTGQKRRVLLVEDEYLVAMLTEEMLIDIGYEVSVTAATLEAGLKAVAACTFDVAVLDVNLRGDLSFPIADILRERGIPCMFASGYTAQGIEPSHSSAIRIQKPFTDTILQLAMSQTLINAGYEK